jgi:hypothetical protein
MEVGDRERLPLMRTGRLIKVPNYMLINNPVTILDLSWKQPRFSKEERINRLLPVVVPENANDRQGPYIYQDASIYISLLTPEASRVHMCSCIVARRTCFVIHGKVKPNGNDTKTRDQARVENESKLLIQADKLTEMFILNVPAKYAIDN